MKARYLFSMLAAIACPVMVSAQAPDRKPDGPPPDRRESRPPDDRPGPLDGHRHHHRHMTKQDGDGRPGDPRERLGHMMEAAHHLRAAGMNELADNLENQARKMREEFAERGHRDRDGDGRPGGRPDRGNFASPQGAPDIRAQLERIMKDVQELRQEVRRMKAERNGPSRDGNGPHHFGAPFQRRMDNPPGPDGDRRRDGHRDGANQPPRGERPPGPGPQANGPQNDQPPFPRPEWRDHNGPKKPEGDRGDKRDGGRPPGPPVPPPGDRPGSEPAHEGAIPDNAAPAPPPLAPAPEAPPAPPAS